MQPTLFLATPLEGKLKEAFYAQPPGKQQLLNRSGLQIRTHQNQQWLIKELPFLPDKEALEDSYAFFKTLINSLIPQSKLSPPYVLSLF